MVTDSTSRSARKPSNGFGSRSTNSDSVRPARPMTMRREIVAPGGSGSGKRRFRPAFCAMRAAPESTPPGTKWPPRTMARSAKPVDLTEIVRRHENRLAAACRSSRCASNARWMSGSSPSVGSSRNQQLRIVLGRGDQRQFLAHPFGIGIQLAMQIGAGGARADRATGPAAARHARRGVWANAVARRRSVQEKARPTDQDTRRSARARHPVGPGVRARTLRRHAVAGPDEPHQQPDGGGFPCAIGDQGIRRSLRVRPSTKRSLRAWTRHRFWTVRQ